MFSTSNFLTTWLLLFDVGESFSFRNGHSLVGSFSSTPATSRRRVLTTARKATSLPSWQELEDIIGPCYTTPCPVSVDSVLDPETPSFATDRPTLFRERHGWCPYSERVWLGLELKDLQYDTIRIDNTGGPRPSYYSGQTPQMRWPSGKTQGESMDLVQELDRIYAAEPLKGGDSQVRDCVSKFRNIFPKARPSSRAAFLFQWNGDPLWRSVFEQTLYDTNDLLGRTTDGPFFCGSTLSAADVAWAPFLERYRYQLPCLHEGLDPSSSREYPNLAAWYQAMDQIPAYACRVKGDASSWRKVLTMAGFGNAGVPPQVAGNMNELAQNEGVVAKESIDVGLWEKYASSRPYLARTPYAEAASVLTKNRDAIVTDVLKRSGQYSPWREKGLSTDELELDQAMRAMAFILLHQNGDEAEDAKNIQGVGALASFLDERMCVPRDMGAMSAASIKHLAWELSASC